MNKAGIVAALMIGALLCSALPSWAQFQRHDFIWARSTNGAALTLDGVLNEPQWAQAESLVVTIRQDSGIPGSGWKDEGGFVSADPSRGVFRFLVVGNQLWMSCTVRDSSIGGSALFNRFDGLLMGLKAHDDTYRPAPPREHFMSWWWPVESGDLNPLGINKPMSMIGAWRTWPPGTPATPTQLQAWDARFTVNGTVNSDTLSDQGYTIEMRYDLGMNGYNVTDADGDIVEWNASLYDMDNFWPITNFFRFSVNRTWAQGPWGNDSWYGNVHVCAKPSVTVSSGPVAPLGPDMIIPDGGGYPDIAVDGLLTETVWQNAPSFNVTWDDTTLRKSYPSVGPYRSGQYQAPVNGNGGTAYVADPGDMTVKYFVKNDSLYLGFDVRDAVVQYHSLSDRWDGVVISINDRIKRSLDKNLFSHLISFQVGPTGNLVPHAELAYLRDTLQAVRCNLQLKPGTTLDTTGVDTDAGYTAEFVFDLTKFGYAPGLGDRALYWGCDLMDGDSYSPVTDSYGTRTWYFREWEYGDGPCVAYMNPNVGVTTGVDDAAPKGGRYALLGSFPNPVKRGATIRFTLAEASVVDVDVFDLQGRTVASRSLGLQPSGQREVRLGQFSPPAGVYLYRVQIRDQAGAQRATLSGKMMVLR